jgi:hypothetical protein
MDKHSSLLRKRTIFLIALGLGRTLYFKVPKCQRQHLVIYLTMTTVHLKLVSILMFVQNKVDRLPLKKISISKWEKLGA